MNAGSNMRGMTGKKYKNNISEKWATIHIFFFIPNPVGYPAPDGKKPRYAKGVSEAFKSDFAKIIQHLNKSETSWYVAELEKHPEIIYLEEGKDLDDFYFSPSKDTITINPDEG